MTRTTSRAARRATVILTLALVMLSSLSAKVILSGKGGVGRFFEMAFGSEAGGFLVDGVKAGVNALVDLDDGNMFTLEANAQKAADNAMSVMTFNASFHRDAELSDALSLYMETGVESHLILSDGVSTEIGLACKGGVSIDCTDNMKVNVSAGVSDMLYSTAVNNIYGKASGSVSMIGINAGIECSYTF